MEVRSRRAALYTRVSSAGQVDNYSLDYQEAQLKQYCQRHGIEVAGVYQDAGVSGSTVMDRPAIGRLIADARAGKFNEVLIYKVDRFTRADPWDLYPLIKGLMDLDIKLTSATESFDLTDDNGQLIFSILANFAARERRGIIQRTLGGKRAAAREGRYTGGRVPFGYRVDPQTGRFVPDETPWWNGLTKAQVAAQIFYWYLELQSTSAVSRRLREYGVPAPEIAWTPAVVGRLLRNPVYKGDFAWGKRSHPLNQSSRVNPGDEWIVCHDSHPPLVSKQVWDETAQLLCRNRRGGRRPRGEKRVLDRFLQCEVCGSTLTPRAAGAKRDEFFYTCASRFNHARRRQGTACTGAPYWHGPGLAGLVWNRIVAIITGDSMLKCVLREMEDRGSVLQQAIAQLEQAQRRLEQVERKKERLVDLALAGNFDAETMQRKQGQLERERQDALKAIEQSQTRLAAARQLAATDLSLVHLKMRLSKALQSSASTNQKRQILSMVLDGKIVVSNDGHVRIRLRPGLG